MSQLDALAMGRLLLLTALVAWQRLWLWNGLAYLDVATFYLPWYAFMGEHLRALDVPGWNPHQFGGAPFAGDPQSGWTYLPAMLFFTFLKPVLAYKLFLAFHLLLAGVSAFVLARLLGMRPVGALAAALAYEFGPLASNLSCCLIRPQLAVWIPPALIGVELAARAGTRTGRSAAWTLTAVAVSQMLAGWIGQGAYGGMLVVGSYLLYRFVASPPTPRPWGARVVGALTAGFGSFLLGGALAAAGVLPRLDAVRETNVSGGQYSGTGTDDFSGGWKVATLADRLFNDGKANYAQIYYLGGATVTLALLAVFFARRRQAVPYFLALLVVVSILTLKSTPVHEVFYLLPRFRVLQEHVPSRILAVQWIAAAMLAGASVDAIQRGFVSRWALLGIATAIAGWGAVFLLISRAKGALSRATELSVLAVLLLAGLAAAAPAVARRRPRWPAERTRTTAAVLLLLLILWEPTGRVFAGAVLGHGSDRVLSVPQSPISPQAVDVNAAVSDPKGAGEFLQQAVALDGPARFFGYDDALQRGGNSWPSTYREWYFLPEAQDLLVNARAMMLGLDDVQGYNPVQLSQHAEFLTAVNRQTQNYHDAQILPGGLASPLLNLLNARYVVVPNAGPPGRPRPDLLGLTARHREVFRNASVRVLLNADALPRAWVVHQTLRVTSRSQITILQANLVDPRRMAVIAGAAALPPLARPADPSLESVAVVGGSTDSMELQVRLGAAGLLVVSETYADGWHAYVDGARAPLYPTDGALRGVPVPAGAHRVELRYEPASLRIGLAVSAAAILTALLLLAMAAWTARRRVVPSVPSAPVAA